MQSERMVVTLFSLESTPVAAKIHPMLRNTMIVLATAAALTGELPADAFAIAAGHGGPFGEFTEQSVEQGRDGLAALKVDRHARDYILRQLRTFRF